MQHEASDVTRDGVQNAHLPMIELSNCSIMLAACERDTTRTDEGEIKWRVLLCQCGQRVYTDSVKNYSNKARAH